jgi:hypothetical protein
MDSELIDARGSIAVAMTFNQVVLGSSPSGLTN